MKIAVVDDERPARRELSFQIVDILPEAEILEAESGSAALELLLSTPDISLAFLDINLTDMEGTTLAAALQKILPDVPWGNNGLALKLNSCGSAIFPIRREKTKSFRLRMRI